MALCSSLGGTYYRYIILLPIRIDSVMICCSKSIEISKDMVTGSPCATSIVGSLRDREVACSASDRQGSNFESCVWRTVSSQSSHHPQEVLLAQFSLYVHKGGLKPDSFHFQLQGLTNLTCCKRSLTRQILK